MNIKYRLNKIKKIKIKINYSYNSLILSVVLAFLSFQQLPLRSLFIHE